MNKDIIDSINNIVWIIPIKKIRDSVRKLLTFHAEKKLEIENLTAFSIVNETSDDFVIKCIASGFIAQIEHYFWGRYIELKYNRKVKYDLATWYAKPDINGTRKSIIETNRDCELLNLFPNLIIEEAKDFEICAYKKLYNTQNNKTNTLEGHINDTKNRVYIGDFSCYIDVFDDEIREIIKREFDFDKSIYPLLKDKNLDYYNEIKSREVSIGIHVRRGDYLIIGEDRIPDANYFIKAIELISTKVDIEKAKLFFFSYSMNWVSENIIPKIKNKYDYVLVDGNDESSGYIDFYLLMSTQHQITSVGSFGHKAHFFNSYKDKLLVYPSENFKPEIIGDSLFE